MGRLLRRIGCPRRTAAARDRPRGGALRPQIPQTWRPPTGERYVLVWLDGDILYYGSDDRITILALDTQTDTLMVSPGEDYTRQSENER